MRQNARRTAEASKNFFVVRFHADQYIAVTPGKAIHAPPPSSLGKGSDCQVKWSDSKLYSATVLAVTGKCIMKLHTLLSYSTMHTCIHKQQYGITISPPPLSADKNAASLLEKEILEQDKKAEDGTTNVGGSEKAVCTDKENDSILANQAKEASLLVEKGKETVKRGRKVRIYV